MAGVKRSWHSDSEIRALHKELDEVSCPICMDYPHNAVLLVCSSHNKGCRSYICDTSYRHSNCLDRFKKLKSKTNSTSRSTSSLNTEPSNNAFDNNSGLSNGSLEALRDDNNRPNNANQNSTGNLGAHVEGTLQLSNSLHVEDASDSKLGMNCPLCRGVVLGFEVINEARNYLNSKSRSCSRELCSFAGNYVELRRHARRVHPTSRPSDIDPSRERAWRRLEHQREYIDIVSAIQSAIPGAVVVGDYVIEDGDGGRIPSERGSGPWLTSYLFQMVGAIDSGRGSRSRHRPWRRHQNSRNRTSGGGYSRRRMLWGENLLGVRDEGGEEDDGDGNGGSQPRRRRRLTQWSSGDH